MSFPEEIKDGPRKDNLNIHLSTNMQAYIYNHLKKIQMLLRTNIL